MEFIQEGIQVETGIGDALQIHWGRWVDEPPDDTASGSVPVTLFDSLPPGTRANPGITLTVTGRPFHGLLENLAGARSNPSPVVYDSNGAPQSSVSGQDAFIIDFGVSVSLLGLELTDPNAPDITLVLPWLGTDFSPRSAFPPAPAQFPLPVPATTNLSPGVALTGVETTKVLVQYTGTTIDPAGFPHRCRITTGTFPTNVKASLNGRLPFWTKPGPLRDQETAAGFVEDLNTLLGTLTAPAKIVLSLTTDLPGVLTAGKTVPAGGLVHAASARWGGQPTTQLSLSALEPQALDIPFPVDPDSTASWTIDSLGLQIAGAFPGWRSYPGQDAAAPGNLGMRVDANFGVARHVALAAGDLFGFAVPVRGAAADGQVHLEVQADKAGLPGGGKPLGAADLTVPAAPAGSTDPVWHEVLFASPLSIKAGPAGVWLVAKAKTGSIEWVAATQAPAAGARTVFAAEGGPWEDYPEVDGAAPVAQVRILRRPFPSENTPLLDVAWSLPAGATAQSDAPPSTTAVDLGAPAGPPATLAPAGGAVTVTLSVVARASGTLTVKAATATYEEVTP